MRRRLLICAICCCPAGAAFAQDEPSGPRHKVSARELRKELMARFPVRFAVPGLFDARLDATRLLLLPQRQRIGASLDAKLRDLSAGVAYAGEIDLVFAVRWEPSDQTLRAHNLEVLALRAPGLPADAARAWQGLLGNALRGAVNEVVLHRFSAGELALPDLLGVRPDRIVVEDDGLAVWFAPKAHG